MKNNYIKYGILILHYLIVFLLSYTCKAQAPDFDNHWQLIGGTNFKDVNTTISNPSGPTIITSNALMGSLNPFGYTWEIANGFAHDNPAYYLTGNVDVNPTDGLILSVKKPLIPVNGYFYTGAEISSQKDINGENYFKYGYLEIKMNTNNDTYGTYPAYWTWTEDTQVNPKNYDEIDIFEIEPGNPEADHDCYGYNGLIHNRNYLTSNIHINLNDEIHCTINDRKCIRKIPGNNGYLDPHIYGVEWSPSKLIFYIDGKMVRNSENPNYNTISNSGNIEQKTSVFLSYVINNFVGWKYAQLSLWPHGYFEPSLTNYEDYYNPSTHDPNSPSAYRNYIPADLNTNQNLKMYVEYFKYYKLRNENCSTTSLVLASQADWSLNSQTLDDDIQKDITINGSGTQTSDRILRANDFIKINGEFKVDLNNELYLDVNPCY